MRTRVALLLLLLLLVILTGCTNQQINLPVGLDLYKQGEDAPTVKLTDIDIASDPLVIDSDREGFGKLIIFNQNGEGTEWYYRISDLPVVQPEASDAQNAQGQAALPPQLSAFLQWADTYLFGLWQLWVGIALSTSFSIYIYRWLMKKKTPKPMKFTMDKIPTANSVLNFNLQLEASYIEATVKDREDAFKELGKNEGERTRKAQALYQTHLEGDITALSILVAPENINKEISKWVRRMNEVLKNVDWGKIEGTVLEGFPVTGLELRSIKLVGFIPNEDMRNYLSTPNEANQDANAIKKISEEAGISRKQATDIYPALKASSAVVDAARAISEGIAKAFTGGDKQ